MSLIDETYFILDINLPAGQYNDIDAYIERFEPKILERAFGYSLAKDIQAYDPDEASPALVALVEGAEFVVNDVTYKWRGLINDGKVSLIAYYVYYWQRRSTVTTTTAQGEMARNAENMAAAEYGIKIMAAWDSMLREIDSVYAFIQANEADYPTFRGEVFGSVNAFDL